MTVRIVTDSACDLPDDVVERHALRVVPLSIRFGAEELLDRVQLSVAEFWTRLATSTVPPETAAPAPGAFATAFSELADAGADAVVCLTLSGDLSATHQSAVVGAREVADRLPVRVVDTRSVSSGLGSIVLGAARVAAAGGSVEAVEADARARMARTSVYASPDTLEYMRRSGRVSGAKAFLASALAIKPIVVCRDGLVVPADKVRTRGRALTWLAERVAAEAPVEDLAVFHAQAPDVDELVERIRPFAGPEGPLVTTIGPVVGSHAGPGTIGIAYSRP